MISIIYDQKTVVDCGDGRVVPKASVLCTGDDVSNLPTENIHNGADAYIMDWHELDSAIRSEIGNQLLLFDAAKKRWIPQKSLYGT